MPAEVASLDQLRELLRGGAPLHGLRLQDLDLTPVQHQLLRRSDLDRLVVLGGRVPPALDAHLRAHGAFVFPTDPGVPFDPWSARLYRPQELYAGLTDGGYAATPDARTYRWSLQQTSTTDVYATLLRAVHDDTIGDALQDFLTGRRVVGVMGGHDVRRDTPAYAAAAHLGHELAATGATVLTGGGPGAMEAAGLGAFAPDEQSLTAALHELAQVPDFAPDITAWAQSGLRVRAQLAAARGDDDAPSLGVPTWFYGHEPPGVFVQWSAKYFDNALREDVLLRASTGGLIVLPGAAGTVQEIFQAATRLYYASGESPIPAMVLVGIRHWTEQLPVWPLLQQLGSDRPMAGALHLVDAPGDAVALLTR